MFVINMYAKEEGIMFEPCKKATCLFHAIADSSSQEGFVGKNLS
jgi:hypothetical protein